MRAQDGAAGASGDGPSGDGAATGRASRGRLFHRRYGESPWQLALLAASFALTGYAGVRLLDGDTLGVLVWFAGAALLHDLVLLPLYSLADRLPRLAGRYVNHVRVPAALSGLLLLVWFPLIVGTPARYEGVTGLPGDDAGFALRWLLITAALFALSGLLLLGRIGRITRITRVLHITRTARTSRRAPAHEDRRSTTNSRPPDAH